MDAGVSPAEQVARDIAEFMAAHEQPLSKWMAVAPVGAESLIAGYEVLPHVQRFADAVRVATGVQSIGTYPGHSPSLERALDLFVPNRTNPLADAICGFALGRQQRYGVRYVISRQRIWHRLDPVWRPMENRGDDTQNHFDHVHVSFETEAAGDEPEPKPEPIQEDYMFVIGDAPPERGGGVWRSNGLFRTPVRTGATWSQMGDDGAKVAKHIGVFEVGTFDDLIDFEAVLAELRDVPVGTPPGVDISALADLVAAQITDRIAATVADVIHHRLAG